MIDKNNLNRVKGILSAKQGAEVPKFAGGAKLAKQKGNQIIYSGDKGDVWFSDINLTTPYTGSMDDFKDITIEEAKVNLEVPGDPKLTPTSAVEQASVATKSVDAAEKVENQKQKKEADNNSLLIAALNGLVNPNGATPQTKTQGSSNGMNPSGTGSPNGTTPETAYSSLGNMGNKKWGDMSKQDKVNFIANEAAERVTGAFTAVGSAVGAKQAATDSQTTQTVDAAYDTIASGLQQAGGIAGIVGTAMQFAGMAGDIAQELGGGTDQQTKTDQWMDSSFFSWNIGLLNGFAGKEADTFGVDQSTAAKVGSSYGGSLSHFNELSEKSGKKYGLFSSKARKKLNKEIATAHRHQDLMADIADDASDQRAAVDSMGEQAGLAYSMMTGGGYDQRFTYSAKQGGLLEWNPTITLEWEPQVDLNWELPKFKDGGNIELVEELEWIPEFKSGNKIRTIEELIEYAKKQNPRFIQRLSEEPRGIKFTDDEGKEAEGSHYLESRGEYVISRIQEVNGELQFFNPQDALNKAIETGNYLKLDPEEAIIFAEQYKQGWPEFFKKFKEGGSVGNSDAPEIEETTQKNVIPEGALHKNKHHMEHAEGLTKKGIPVIDDDGEQQAEIEHSEIIFTLEVTKKLEEYYKVFYSDDSTNKEKEQAALDAGKLLVYQILENTEDRTGLIESCKRGGSLTLKNSVDDVLEELLDWTPELIIIKEETLENTSSKEKDKDDTSMKDVVKDAIKEVLLELLTK